MSPLTAEADENKRGLYVLRFSTYAWKIEY